MARPGLYKEVSSPGDDLLQRIQKNVKDAVDTLTADDDVLRVPATSMIVTGPIPSGKSVVVFSGASGQALTLPQAKAQGQNVAAQLIVANTSANDVALVAVTGDTVDGVATTTVAAGTAMFLTSDGINAWQPAWSPLDDFQSDLRLISLRV